MAKYTYKSCAQQVGLDGSELDADAIRKQVKTLQESGDLALALEDWMHEIVSEASRTAGPDDEAVARDIAIQSAAKELSRAWKSGREDYTARDAAKEFGLDDGEATGVRATADVQAIRRAANALPEEEEDDDGQDDTAAEVTADIGRNRRGHGRPRKDPSAAPPQKLYGSHGVTHETFKELVAAAAAEIHRMDPGEKWPAAERFRESLQRDHGLKVASRTLFERSKRLDESVDGLGGRYFSNAFEQQLAAVIRYFRERKYPVFKEDVLGWALHEVKRTGLDVALPALSKGWYYRFLDRVGFSTGASRPLETVREKWCTSANIETYYNIIIDTLVEEGIAIRNPDFDPDVPYSNPITIVHPERLISYDETDASLDQSAATKAGTTRTVRVGRGDNGQVLATKSSVHVTAVGGRIGYKALPPLIVFGSGSSMRAEWCTVQPIGNVIRGVMLDEKLPDGTEMCTELLSAFLHNDKGSMDAEFCTAYTTNVIIPCARKANPALANETGKRSVEICDGVQVHLSLDRINALREAGIICILRVPHTTHVTQGEDTAIFSEFKNDFARRKMEVLVEKRRRHLGDCLTLEDFAACFKQPWEKAFRREKVVEAWKKDGIIPFDRACMWRVKLEEEARKVSAARVKNHETLVARVRSMRADVSGMVGAASQAGERGSQHADDGEESDGDGRDEGAPGRDGNGVTAPAARARGQVAAPDIRAAIEKFTPSEEQEPPSQMSPDTCRAKLRSIRDDQRVARHALRDADREKERVAASKISLKSGGIWNLGPITSDRTTALVQQQTDSRKREREEKEARSMQRAKNSRVKASEDEETARNTLASIREGTVETLTELSLTTLRSLLAHLLPNVRAASAKRKEEIVAILSTDCEDIITAVAEGAAAREAREAIAARRARQRHAAVPGGANVRPPSPSPPTTAGRGRGRGRGREMGTSLPGPSNVSGGAAKPRGGAAGDARATAGPGRTDFHTGSGGATGGRRAGNGGAGPSK